MQHHPELSHLVVSTVKTTRKKANMQAEFNYYTQNSYKLPIQTGKQADWTSRYGIQSHCLSTIIFYVLRGTLLKYRLQCPSSSNRMNCGYMKGIPS